MKLNQIVATVPTSSLANVEEALGRAGVKAVSVNSVESLGQHAHFYFGRDTDHTRIELYVDEPRVDAIVAIILQAVCAADKVDGFIAVLPVQAMYRVGTREKVAPADL
jgi:nitrogen regulatory protein PII